MQNIHDFIAWGLTHVDPETLIKSATYPIPQDQIGVDPVHYLYGTVWTQTTQQALDWKYNDYYGNPEKNNPPMSREEYDKLTGGWRPIDRATDCQGLLDAWLTVECNELTDINADYNYRYWCENTGRLSEIDRPYVIGEAVFMANSSSKKYHVGWVCGFTDGGHALVMEARNIKHGVVITMLSARGWTHRGLMTKKFDYSEPQPAPTKTRFEITSPYQRGMAYKKMQDALDDAGYTDADGKRLEIDGIWGPKSQQALDTLVADYAAVPEPVPIAVLPPTVGRFDLEDAGLTVCIFRTADMPPDAENGVKKA